MFNSATVSAYPPARAVAIIMAGFISVVAAAPATNPIIAPMAKVGIDVPKYCTVIIITKKKQIPARHTFSIENPSRASSKPPAIGSKIWYNSLPAICGTILLMIGIKNIIKL